MEPLFLEVEEVLAIHENQIARHGGTLGIRDQGLLESALAMPRAGMGGEYFHADLYEMGAAYLFHLVKNHPFLDGNKRVGLATALVFLEMNGLWIGATNPQLVDLTLAVAEGRLDKAGIATFLRKHAVVRRRRRR